MLRRSLSVIAICLLVTACKEEKKTPAPVDRPARFTLEQLKDPKTCQTCHAPQYKEWASSMHAYASIDPVFRAMNKRGQRETGGKLGSFCVQCHAPMAFRDGLTEDGSNLDSLPKSAQGVTCYFCHNASGVGADAFNGDVTIAHDDVMRGGFDGVDPGRHGVAKSEFHDRNSAKSSRLCGTCHDVVNDKGVHIERTYKEYSDSVSSLDRVPFSQGGESCQGCHMRFTAKEFVANDPSLTLKRRDLHDHRMPAVDVALTDFDGKEEHLKATKCALSTSVFVRSITADPLGRFSISLESFAGHNQPSGTAQDRRMWMEFIAYDKDDNIIFESGTIKDGEVEQLPNDTRPNRQQLCMFRDHFEDENGKEVHMFWEAFKVTEHTLPKQTQLNATHELVCSYRIPTNQLPARVEMKMKMRPVGIDVLQSLVESGDLDPKIIEALPTFTLHSTHVEWRDGEEYGFDIEKPTPLSEEEGCE